MTSDQGPAPKALRLSRRTLLGAAGGLSTSLLVGCTGGGDPTPAASGGGPDTGTVLWWDHFRPLTKVLTDDLFTPFAEANAGVEVDRREMDPAALGQALQLGRRSQQLPDVHSLAGLDSAPALLVDSGWFQPIGDYVDVEASPVADLLVDGVHRFDDKVYSVPIFSSRWHDASPWLNTELLEAADLDPESSPASWDDFGAALRKLRSANGKDVHPIVLPAKAPDYLLSLLERFAMSAGAIGSIDPRTGEYAYTSAPYADAMEWLLSLHADGLVHPASASMDQRDARARWAAGEAAVYPWGPWFIGGLAVQEPEAIERGVGVWRIPTSDGSDPVIYSGPPGGTFWVSSQAKHASLGAQVLLAAVDPGFQRKLASAMDQPPVLIDQVAGADVHPTYAANIELMTSDVRMSPTPQARNPDVSRVLAEMRDINPGLGEIVQAAFTDNTADWKGGLATLQDAMTAERDRAIEAVNADGGSVSVDDWVFSDWVPGQDWVS